MIKTIVITGATSGIGLAVVRTLAAQGCRVLAAGRSQASCDAARAAVLQDMPGADIYYFFADLRQQKEVRRLAEELSAYLEQNCDGRLDVLINNAGGVWSKYQETDDGYEQQFALNHLAGFLLTSLLMTYLRKAAGRLIMTGSYAHKKARINWQDIMYKKHYNILFAYRQSKLCNLLFAAEFNRRFAGKEDRGVRAYVVNPGLVRTDIGNKHATGLALRVWLRFKKRGIDPVVPAQTFSYLCHELPRPQGLYYYLCQAQAYSRRAADPQDAARLFELSEKLCGIKFFSL